MQSACTPAVLLGSGEALRRKAVGHGRTCPRFFMKLNECRQCHRNELREGILEQAGVLHRMRRRRTLLTPSLLVMKSPYWMLKQHT